MTWHVAYTRPRAEQEAVEELQELGVGTFLPIERRWVSRERQGKRRRTAVERPLFPGYLFVSTREPMPHCYSVLAVVGEIRGAEVERLARWQSAGLFDRTRSQPYEAGQAVRLLEGPFAGLASRVVDMPDRQRVRVLLDFLGATRKIVVPVEQVEPATEP